MSFDYSPAVQPFRLIRTAVVVNRRRDGIPPSVGVEDSRTGGLPVRRRISSCPTIPAHVRALGFSLRATLVAPLLAATRIPAIRQPDVARRGPPGI